eukprot:CAMPEP_0116100814 /NCGR_PEP_ID=MMETSP0327-20121206/12480_1 /TAXON_ID=44447 /ORGANISM="Pseudo-nitzschia delicatissima, Strain B596" /LENGTH=225 /DNA_ID=CAMNT_0003592739 /DNA_START=86 /DNA_END=763 /DNA_ORIENTATION=-
MNSSIFIPIDLEASLGKIEDASERKRKASQEQTSSPSSRQENGTMGGIQSPARAGVTRTSSRTPFLTEGGDETRKNGSSNSLLKPYPISESHAEISERKRLTDAVDWSNGLVVNSPPTTSVNAPGSSSENADQQSMMEVTVDDFVLSPEEAKSVTDMDAMTIQDEDFWETPVQVANTLSMNASDVGMMTSVPFSVTFSSQDPIDDLDNDDELTDAAPIRSVDMEW